MIQGWAIASTSDLQPSNSTISTLKQCQQECKNACKSFSYDDNDNKKRCNHYNEVLDISKVERMQGGWIGLDSSNYLVINKQSQCILICDLR